MKTATRTWLRTLEGLGDQARRRVFVLGEPAQAVTQALADASVDPRQDVDWLGLCDDLGVTLRKPNVFAAQVELHQFSLSVIAEMVEAAA